MISDIYLDVSTHLNGQTFSGVNDMSDARLLITGATGATGGQAGKNNRHPLDQVIWRALNSVQASLAEGDERARRYPAAIAPFGATIDLEPLSFRSLLTLIGPADDRIALGGFN